LDALKAQALFPTLEGIAQMITTFSIYLASMVKIGGETNWYSILSLPMSVDDHALKKGIGICFFRATQIRTNKLVLMMLFIWSKRLIECYLTKKEKHNMTKRYCNTWCPIQEKLVLLKMLPESSTSLQPIMSLLLLRDQATKWQEEEHLQSDSLGLSRHTIRRRRSSYLERMLLHFELAAKNATCNTNITGNI
jgi:hypothetical protein